MLCRESQKKAFDLNWNLKSIPNNPALIPGLTAGTKRQLNGPAMKNKSAAFFFASALIAAVLTNLCQVFKDSLSCGGHAMLTWITEYMSCHSTD